MISVLIPVYNRDVTKLTHDLSSQAKSLSESIEIVLLDDGSAPSFRLLNNKLGKVPFVRYLESGQNVGRIRIRSMLAQMALYDWLLFLDCDSKLVSPDFLNHYLTEISASTDVISGGTVYTPSRPVDCRFRLHWKYGSVREKTSSKPGSGNVKRFMTNNFLIRKKVFEKLAFSGLLQGYGYEDTWMLIKLEEMRASLRNIPCPVLHDGIDDAGAFIKKSENAMRNLRVLSKVIPHRKLTKHVKLFYYYNLLKKYHLLWVIKTIYFLGERIIRKNLVSCSPSLKLFDLYRLHYFIRAEV